MDYITFQDADNTATNYGGAIENAGGGVLDISGCTFLDDVARNGGAIDNGDNHGGGTLDVSGSRFSRDSAIGTKGGTGDGGAIDNGDNGGTGKLTVSSSTFSGNSAIAAKGGTGDGGAIDNSDNGGTGTLTALSCTFSRNTATGDLAATDGGGAIDNADNGGTGTFSVSGSTLTANAAKYGGAIADVTGTGRVSGSTFSANTAAYGGAIDNGRRVSGFASTSISGSTFVANSATGNGGAIDNGDSLNVSGNLVVAASTFTGNTATGRVSSTELLVFDKNGDGGAIDNGDNEGTGTLVVTASTFSGNSAQRAGGALDNFTTLWASGDILNGACGESTGGLWNDEGYNIGSTTCVRTAVGDVRQGARKLGPLGDNGEAHRDDAATCWQPGRRRDPVQHHSGAERPLCDNVPGYGPARRAQQRRTALRCRCRTVTNSAGPGLRRRKLHQPPPTPERTGGGEHSQAQVLPERCTHRIPVLLKECQRQAFAPDGLRSPRLMKPRAGDHTSDAFLAGALGPAAGEKVVVLGPGRRPHRAPSP